MVATACRRNCTQEAAQCRHISRWARRGRERFGTRPGVLPWLWAQQPSRRRCHRSSDCPRQFQPPRVVGPYRPRRTPRVSPYHAAAAGTAGGLALRLVPRENRRNSRAQLRRCRLLLPKTLRIRTAAGLPARVRASRGGAGAAAAVTHASTTSLERWRTHWQSVGIDPRVCERAVGSRETGAEVFKKSETRFALFVFAPAAAWAKGLGTQLGNSAAAPHVAALWRRPLRHPHSPP